MNLAGPHAGVPLLHSLAEETKNRTMTQGRGQRIADWMRSKLTAGFITMALGAILGGILPTPIPALATSAADSSYRAAIPQDTAQTVATAEDGSPEDETPAGYPVRLGDRELYRLSAADRARSAEERARTGSDRYRTFAHKGYPVDPVRVNRTEYGADVTFGDRLLFTVFDVDTTGTGKDVLSLAKERAGIVRGAVLEYREARSARNILLGCALTIVATIALLLGLRAIGAVYRRTRAGISAWVGSREENIRKRTAAVVRGSHIQTVLGGLLDLARVILVFLLLFVYVRVVLARFPWTRPIAMDLDQMLLGPLTSMGRSLLDALPGLVFIGVVFVIAHYVIRLLRFLAMEIEAGHIEIPGFYTEWAKPTYNIVRVLVAFFAIVVCYPYIPGSQTEAFKGVSIFIGVLLSLGSTSAVSNLVAGFVLTYMRGYRVGDIIQVEGDRGMVVEMTLLATRIRTPKNEVVTIPNATVIGSRITNYSRMAKDPGLILHTTVTVGYDAPWRQVHAMLLQAADRTEGIKKDPAPFVLQTGLEQVQVAYEINAYTDHADRMLRIYSELRQNIQDAFNEYGVQIMTPFYEGDKAAPLVVPKEKWYAAPAKEPGGSPAADPELLEK
jgi:small-conductance mechanosensitive channel